MRLLLSLMLITSIAFSQKSDQQLAYQYYINGEYEKAISLYEELMNQRFSVVYYTPYFSALLKTKNYKSAEALAKRLVRKNPKSLTYSVEVGIAQEKAGDNRKAEKTYKKVYDKLDGRKISVINIANTFFRHQMYDKALEVYLFSEKKNPKNNYSTQKAQLYGQLGKSALMIEEYLNELARDPSKKQLVLSKVQKFLDNDGIKSDKNYQFVKKALLPLVRSEENRTDFTEMLIWLFMQNHQFKMALIQAKSLDKRIGGDGDGVYELGETFLDQEYYDLAISAYEYVIRKGVNSYLYIDANINKLFALSKKISSNQEEINKLDNAYQHIVLQLGSNKNTVVLLSNYAHFKGFILHDLISAEQILLDAMQIPGIDRYDLAECKMEYADVQLLQGNIWESLLYFSQVEKEFKEHPIGHEAKLRRAKISYFQGDFHWAQAQLGALKASTSKLIANDAMELSLLITDNYNLDTTEIAMRVFANADLLYYQQRYQEAIDKYDSVLLVFTGHPLTDEIYMRKAEIYLKQNKIELATAQFLKVEQEWGYDILADDALYKRAKIYEEVLMDKKLAMNLYEKILLHYKSSIYVTESRKRFRQLRGDNLNIEE